MAAERKVVSKLLAPSKTSEKTYRWASCTLHVNFRDTFQNGKLFLALDGAAVKPTTRT